MEVVSSTELYYLYSVNRSAIGLVRNAVSRRADSHSALKTVSIAVERRDINIPLPTLYCQFSVSLFWGDRSPSKSIAIPEDSNPRYQLIGVFLADMILIDREATIKLKLAMLAAQTSAQLAAIIIDYTHEEIMLVFYELEWEQQARIKDIWYAVN